MENSNMSDPAGPPPTNPAPPANPTPSGPETAKQTNSTATTPNKPLQLSRNGNNNNKRFNNNNNNNNNKNNGDEKKKRRKEQAQYGNYESYYGYRPSGEQDNRVRLFTRELLYQKRCLDIGCNSGYFTIQIAKNYEPRYILGVDIDKTLITKAQKNIMIANAAKNRENKEDDATTTTTTVATDATNNSTTTTITTTTAPTNTTETTSSTSVDPRPSIDGVPYFPAHFGELPPEALALPREALFPSNIHFRGENFIDIEEVSERFDIIFCLSVTKWIHLNWGDEGIKKLFRKIYASLYQGGMFILEPQPWSSYKKRARITPEIHKNYSAVKLRPNDFSTFLTKDVGFKTVQLLTGPSATSKGFDRPVYLYVK